MSQNFFTSWDTSTDEFANISDRNMAVLQTDITTLSSQVVPGCDYVEISLKNRGQTAIADFEQWDFIVQYYDSQDSYYVTYLDYVEGEPANNQWTVKGIYINAGNQTAEILETGILNPEEEIIVRARIYPKVSTHTISLATVSIPTGVTDSIHFSAPE